MKLRILLLAALLGIGLFAGTTERHLKVAVIAPAPYDGAFMIDEPLESQAARADQIVVGRVTDVTSYREPGTIKTAVQIEVEDYVKGSGSAQLTLIVDGGSVGGDTLDVGGVPRFVQREHVLLLLDDSAGPQLLNRWQSKYSLAGSQAYQRGEKASQPIQALEQDLSSALGEPVDLPEETAEVTSLAFTTYCAPWSTADMPVVFEVNPSNPGSGGPSGADFSRLSYESWHAWQALSNSYPSFSYTGTTSRDGQNHTDGFNTIAWASDLGSGTLGVNWCATSGGARYDSDTLLNNANFTWDFDDSDGISSSAYSLQSVMEHELGHGVGLGHSDQTCNGSASTPLMCPAIANGVRKLILSDDQAGAADRYPLSGGAPGVPSNLAAVGGSGSSSLSWSASSGSPIAYDIERGGTTCSGWVSVGTTNATSFVDDDFGGGLPAGNYCYRVKALGIGGESGWSASAQTSPPPPPVSYAKGSSEHQLSAVSNGSNVVLLGRSSTDTLIVSESNGGAFSGWSVVTTGLGSRPEGIFYNGDLYVFYRGAGGDVQYIVRSGGSWGNPVSLGENISKAPVVAEDGDGDLFVAALEPGGTIIYRRFTGGSWSDWLPIPGVLSGQIGLTEHQGDVYIFGLNPTGRSYVRIWLSSSDSWTGWYSLGGVLSGQLSGASYGGLFYVVGVNPNGKSYYRSFDSGPSSWSSWTTLYGVLGPSPAAVATPSDLYVVGTHPSGREYEKHFTSSWTNWASLGGVLASGPELTSVGSEVYVFATHTSGAVYYRLWNGSSWSAWTYMGGTLAVD